MMVEARIVTSTLLEEYERIQGDHKRSNAERPGGGRIREEDQRLSHLGRKRANDT